MPPVPNLFVATNGLSVWHSANLGDSISRLPSSCGMYSGNQVWSLAPDLLKPGRVYAGTDAGLFRLEPEEGKEIKECRWHLMNFPMDDVRLITAITTSAANPRLMFAGTQPSAIYRSVDAGDSWQRLDVPIVPYVASGFYSGTGVQVEESDVRHWTRVTQIVVDDKDPNLVWAGVEIDAIWKSVDGGDTWERTATDHAGLASEDIHGMCLTYNPHRTLHVTTAAGHHVSTDDGVTFTPSVLDSPEQYVRSIAKVSQSDGALLMTNGNGPPGSWGKLFRSTDDGRTWREIALPVPLESSLYYLSVNPADPKLIFAATMLGQIFRSVDGGETWTACRRRLGEIRAILWVP